MEVFKSGKPKIIKSIFLGNLLICRSETDKIKYPEIFKAEKNKKSEVRPHFRRAY